MYSEGKNTELLNLSRDYLIKFLQITYSPPLKFGPVKRSCNPFFKIINHYLNITTNMRVCMFAPHNILILICNIIFSEVTIKQYKTSAVP